MLSTAIYPAFSPRPRRLRPARSPPASCAGGSASKASRSPTRSTPSPFTPSAAPPRSPEPRRRAGADLLLYADPEEAAQAHRALLRALRGRPLPRSSSKNRSAASCGSATGWGDPSRVETSCAFSRARRDSVDRRFFGKVKSRPCRDRPPPHGAGRDTHVVAPRPLGLIHRVVGRREHRVVVPRTRAEHGDPDADGERRRRLARRGVKRIAPAIASATSSASSRSQRGRTTANSSPPSRATTSVSRMRASSTLAMSAITRSPAGWPSVSLTCLKLSRSSISSAPTVCSRRLRAISVRRSSPKRRRFFNPVSGSWLACWRSSCIRSLRLQTRTRAASSAAREMPTIAIRIGRLTPGRLLSRTTSSQCDRRYAGARWPHHCGRAAVPPPSDRSRAARCCRPPPAPWSRRSPGRRRGRSRGRSRSGRRGAGPTVSVGAPSR